MFKSIIISAIAEDCEWTDYGAWSECSRSCDRGTQVYLTHSGT